MTNEDIVYFGNLVQGILRADYACSSGLEFVTPLIEAGEDVTR